MVMRVMAHCKRRVWTQEVHNSAGHIESEIDIMAIESGVLTTLIGLGGKINQVNYTLKTENDMVQMIRLKSI